MSTFKLEIFTPRRLFLSEQVEGVTVCSIYNDKGSEFWDNVDEGQMLNFTDFESLEIPTGELTVLAHHAPMVAALAPGEMRIKINGEWKKAYNSEGFMEVRGNNEVYIFSYFCEWPEDIDEVMAKQLIAKETEELRNARSLTEHRLSEIELQRIFTMLRVKHKNVNN